MRHGETNTQQPAARGGRKEKRDAWLFMHYPFEELGPVPAPPAQRHPTAFGIARGYNVDGVPRDPELVDRRIAEVLAVMRTRRLRLEDALSMVAETQPELGGRSGLLRTFQYWVTPDEEQAADVTVAIFRRRWALLQTLLVPYAAAGQTFTQVCREVARCEDADVDTIMKTFTSRAPRCMTMEIRNEIRRSFPHIGSDDPVDYAMANESAKGHARWRGVAC